MDLPLYLLVRFLVALLSLLPPRISIAVLAALTRAVFFGVPAYRRVALRNLTIAFPDKDDCWRLGVLRDSARSIARLLVDFARLDRLDAAWVAKHVECPLLERYRRIKLEHPATGVILATGHLGSFELLGHCMSVYGHPIRFVVRNFKLHRLDRWWTAKREKYGNRVINRKGAFKEVIADVAAGHDVALLFDQNVKRNHALFVEWFGKTAATTRTIGVAAVRNQAPVIVASIQYLGADRYRINAVECDFSALYADTRQSIDAKVLQVTRRISQEYEAMIRNDPAAWFWVHRRWKTRPLGELENEY